MGDTSGQYDCHVCGESVTASERICPHCGASLIGDVVASRAVEPRAAYTAAKSLSAARGVPFGPLRDGLTGAGVVLTGLSRAEATEVVQLLGTLGVASGFRTAPVSATTKTSPQRAPRRRPGVVAVSVAATLAAALGAAGYVVVRSNTAADGSTENPGIMPLLDAHSVVLDGPAVAARAVPAVVTVHCPSASGTGFYVTPSVVLTSRRVSCRGNVKIELASGRVLDGRVEWRGATVDAATIRTAPVDIEPLWLADATEARAGNTVYSVGSPAGMASTLTRGRVAHAARELDRVSYIQLDQAVNAGDTGAPLLNQRGGVIGIVMIGLAEVDGIGFALPINYVFPGPFGDLPTGWDATAWAMRTGGPPPLRVEPEVATASPPPAVEPSPFSPVGLSLLIVGPATEVMPARWQRGFPSDMTPQALVATTADANQPTMLSFYLHEPASERVCAFTGTANWRSASEVESHYADAFAAQRRIPLDRLSLGLVRLESPTPCTAWAAGTTLEVLGGDNGSNTVLVSR